MLFWFKIIVVTLFLSFSPIQLRAQDGEEVIIIDEEVPWINEKEAPKSSYNVLRIKFEENQKNLSDEDEKAIEAMLKILADPDQKVKIKSYSSDRGNEQKSREIAMQRMLNLREKLINNGYSVNNADFFVFGNYGNKEGLDYIDIDKY